MIKPPPARPLADSWHIFALETNFRCSEAICDAANRLIAHNPDRFEKITKAIHPGGSITVKKCSVPAQEMGFVVDCINDLDANECAVLCRTNRLVEQFSTFLASIGIPVKRKKFPMMPPDWKKAMMLLSLMSNPFNDMAAYLFLIEHVGRERADKIRLEAAIGMVSINDHFLKIDGKNGVLEALPVFGISAESRERIHDVARSLSGNGEWTIPDLIFFLNGGEESRHEIGHGVTVTTIHSAKGREFSTVFLVGCEEGIIPSGKKGTDIAEERRLFFVAITRAKTNLFVSYCENRPQSRGPNMPPGPMEPKMPSRFISEMGL